MARPSKTLADAVHLLQLSELITANIRSVIDAWAKESKADEGGSPDGSPHILPSHQLHQAQRTILASVGALTELVSEPSIRVIEVACQYWESRALAIAAERRIPDLLAQAGAKGLAVDELGEATGIEHLKLARILRCLCSNHVFREIEPDRYTNNPISAALVNNEPLRAYVLLFNLDLYTASDRLPTTLLDPHKGPSYKVDETAFQDAVGTTKARWEWLEEKISPGEILNTGVGYPGMPRATKQNVNKSPMKEDANGSATEKSVDRIAAKENVNGIATKENVSRPELEIFGLAMLGGGRVFGAAHPYDYPWHELGAAVVVDVGGGVGGFDIQLSKLYPELKFVVQDRGPVLKQAEHSIWPKENPAALVAGRVKFMEHDFFQKNPVQGAEVYWMRYILHDWSDEYCIQILKAIRSSMGPDSRILICDQVMNTTLGFDGLDPAPSPLLANYSLYTRYSHQRDLAMMGIINGIERTPGQFSALVEQAELKVEKIWECRSQVSIVELRPSTYQKESS